jgi:pimeloyl-ACP methyl ester carboxylesterase
MAVLTRKSVSVGLHWIVRLLPAAAVGLILVGIVLPCQARPDSRAVIAAAQAVAPGGIQELRSVEIGGIPQWISIRGSDRANPMLLFVHGGPGSPMMPLSWTFQRPWEDFFTVVQWDQRGAGKTFAATRGRPDPGLSIARMQSDTEELIELLLKTYGQKRLFLMGHSWGSILGLKVAQHRPDLLYAYIGVGQVINGRQNEVVGYRQVLAQARAANNREAIQELTRIAPYPGEEGTTPLEKVMIERKWDRFFGGMVYGKTEDDDERIGALSPDYTAHDLASVGRGALLSIQALLPQAAAVDFDNITEFKCPVFFFAGAEDRTTPTSLVEEYFAKIHAPEKRLFKVQKAAHYVVNERPGIVLMDLVNDVRPLFQTSAPP